MTDEEWQGATDPVPLLAFIEGKTSVRKSRLFKVACCRWLDAEMIDERSRAAVVAAERFADGEISPADRFAHWSEAHAALIDVCRLMRHNRIIQIHGLAHDASAFTVRLNSKGLPIDRRVLVGFTRCIFGNPFRLVIVQLSWQTSTVTTLARQMYDARDFSPMPILADALLDAGCESPDVLDHCRGPGPHVRGCFVVDAILEKA